VTHSSRDLLRDGLAAGAVTLACLLLIGIFCQASYHDDQYVYFVIERGMSYADIARRVSLTGLVKDEVVFLLLGRVFGIEHRAKAGRYRLSSTSSMVTILETLYRGATYRERITIRPGKTIESVGHLLTQRASVDSLVFVMLAEDSAFVSRLGVPSTTAEGYLFPDTYDVEWSESPEVVIKQMVSSFSRAFDDSLRARADRLGMSINEAVTLASIIEKEAMLDSERPRISAVFHNRLRIGMKLQADPTVRYALGKWTGRMLYKDLKVESPFNTYWAYGLPPRPICSPGLASLIAAVNPQPGSDDLYFVAQGDGSHYFSRTAGEHQRAKVRYKEYLKSIETQSDESDQEDQGSQGG
jgi:UPF0755 protein